MKIKIKDSKKVGFQPVTIELTLETMNELKSLWCYLNIPKDSVVEYNQKLNRNPKEFISMYDFWDIVDDEIDLQS